MDSMPCDNTQYSHYSRSEMLKFIPEQADRLLDVGCNTGGFGETLKAERKVEVWGLEPNSNSGTTASEKLDKVIISTFNEEAPIPDEYFDVIVFNDVLEHLVDPWAALRLAARKLRPGGRVVASIPNIRHIDNLIHILIDRDFRYEAVGVRDHTHLRFFTRLSALRLFEQSGFEVLTIEGINENWWTPSLLRRVAFRLFNQHLEDTKFIQYAIVAKPAGKNE